MKDIKGFEGLYAVTEDGRVWSYPKDRGRKAHKGKWLKIGRDKDGYAQTRFYQKGRGGVTVKVHRLVAEAFIPNERKKPFVNHLNGVKDDNRVGNLEWCTLAENSKHASDLNLLSYGERHHFCVITDKTIRNIRDDFKKKTLSMAEISRKYGVGYKYTRLLIRRERRAD